MLRQHSRHDVEQARQYCEPGGLEVKRAAPAGRPAERGRQGQAEERVSEDVAGFSPIEMRMGQDDRKAAHHEPEEAEREGPMREADQQRRPRHSLSLVRLERDLGDVGQVGHRGVESVAPSNFHSQPKKCEFSERDGPDGGWQWGSLADVCILARHDASKRAWNIAFSEAPASRFPHWLMGLPRSAVQRVSLKQWVAPKWTRRAGLPTSVSRPA